MKRAQSSYKVHLVNKLLQKGSRAVEIENLKNQIKYSADKYNQLGFHTAQE